NGSIAEWCTILTNRTKQDSYGTLSDYSGNGQALAAATRSGRSGRPLRPLRRPRAALLLPPGRRRAGQDPDIRTDQTRTGMVAQRPPATPGAGAVGDHPQGDGRVHRPLRAAAVDDRRAGRG